ncbi:Verru_Chthon cassette protein A [Prosthecobacter debontii]|uniref:Verru_Chthon cassette protein A n=1 Tax=Prosthecobacter debontii TaxID=48467 RepID=A0A1T4YC24_9BACT|nr:Verru_Chthon cassette protein A [Prosthecobacter debontii]SKA99387.1 Verru_Chthon cassette protein A [Prosthecobacter debontii]
MIPFSQVSSPPPDSPRQGLALIITLSMLALMMVVMAAFLTLSGEARKESSLVVDQQRARLHAMTAVNVALAQLRQATEQTFPSQTPKPWTSQPGAIRVHNMDGTLNTLYKLYSSNSMTATALTQVAADLPDDWKTKPDDFIDLNEPVRAPDGSLSFPIVDPRAWSNDPKSSVEGFRYLEEKGALGPSKRNADQQRLPMPVRWLYVLQDGTLGTLDTTGRFTAPGNKKATRSNPIVGRVAFWVDDETSKVNINTAAEGSFWDTPRADTSQERALAQTLPSRLEYMRQPGHPAGVCLSSVLLPHRRQSPMQFPVPNSSSMEEMNLRDARNLWRLGRLTIAERDTSTSVGGTTATDWPALWGQAPTESVRQSRYSSVDELLFDHVDANRFPGLWEGNSDEDASTQRRLSPFFKDHPESISLLKKSPFFLTARSAGPETTLFGTPRISMWPMHAQTLTNGNALGSPDTSRDTVFNHKMALSTYIKNRPYFVQRSEPGNGIMDFRGHMGGANRVLLEHLRSLTSRAVPGFERPSQGYSTFLAKYGDDRDAILIEMMDYVRSANFAEHQLADIMQFSVLCPGVEHEGFGQVSPMILSPSITPAASTNYPQGFGRSLTISEVALIITCRAEVDADGKIQGEPSPQGRAILEDEKNPAKPGDRELDVGFLVEAFLPGQGWTDYRPFANLALAGGAPGTLEVDHRKAPLPTYYINGIPLEPKSTHTEAESTALPPSSWSGAGGSLGVRGLSSGMLQFKPIVVRVEESSEPPVLTLEAPPDETNQLKIALYDAPASTSATDLLQVVPLALPDIPASFHLRLPRLARDVPQPDLATRMETAAKTGTSFISAEDVIQSLTPMHGDYRLTAAQRWAESRSALGNTPVFAPHPHWGRLPQVHSLRDQILVVDPTQRSGYLPDLSFASAYTSDMPPLLADRDLQVQPLNTGEWISHTFEDVVNGQRLDAGRRGDATPNITGDFDNGIANAPDGPYINRPDDGHWAAARTGQLPYFTNVSQTGTTVPPVSLAAFSPQRLLPSPVMFGSLPSGTRAQVPWQTLLFRPQATHFGAQTPPDHLLLDLFWSPVLEPEPLSTHLETEGKINLNHQILPFRHITRATALHAALKAETLMAIPDTAASSYKDGSSPDDRFRAHLNAEQTVDLWDQEVFAPGNVFLTPGQICEHYLVPEGLTSSSGKVTRGEMEAFWARHRITGDNSKERPYAHLYSRLTTRSNTYRVHFIAQSLVKKRSSSPQTFKGTQDRITSTYSGSVVISRQLDLENPDLPDYQTSGTHAPLDHFYRWNIGPPQ